MESGGKVYFLDTGSTDNTVAIGLQAGLTQIEEVISHDEWVNVVYDKADSLQKFLGEREDLVFNFSAARNDLSDQMKEEWVLVLDADDVVQKFDFNEIQRTISEMDIVGDNVDYMKYWYVYGPNFEFYRSHVFYRRTKFKWEGVCHEYITTVDGKAVKEHFLPKEVMTVVHYGGLKKTRQTYLKALVYQYLLNRSNTRSIYYLGRELYIRGHYFEAVEILHKYQSHAVPGLFPGEEAEAKIFIGKSYEALRDFKQAKAAYIQALSILVDRRILMCVAEFFHTHGSWKEAVAFATAALEMPPNESFLNDPKHSGDYPYEILYLGLWYTGKMDKARSFFKEALLLNYEKHKHNINYFLC